MRSLIVNSGEIAVLMGGAQGCLLKYKYEYQRTYVW